MAINTCKVIGTTTTDTIMITMIIITMITIVQVHQCDETNIHGVHLTETQVANFINCKGNFFKQIF